MEKILKISDRVTNAVDRFIEHNGFLALMAFTFLVYVVGADVFIRSALGI